MLLIIQFNWFQLFDIPSPFGSLKRDTIPFKSDFNSFQLNRLKIESISIIGSIESVCVSEMGHLNSNRCSVSMHGRNKVELCMKSDDYKSGRRIHFNSKSEQTKSVLNSSGIEWFMGELPQICGTLWRGRSRSWRHLNFLFSLFLSLFLFLFLFLFFFLVFIFVFTGGWNWNRSYFGHRISWWLIKSTHLIASRSVRWTIS